MDNEQENDNMAIQPSKSEVPTELGEKLSALAETFPTLRSLVGIRPFDPDALAGLDAELGEDPSPEQNRVFASVEFILWLYVWEADRSGVLVSNKVRIMAEAWELGLAVGYWDRPHRQAFAAWALQEHEVRTIQPPTPKASLVEMN